MSTCAQSLPGFRLEAVSGPVEMTREPGPDHSPSGGRAHLDDSRRLLRLLQSPANRAEEIEGLEELRGIALRIAGRRLEGWPREDTEDVASDVVTIVLNGVKARRLRNEGALIGYIATIVKHEVGRHVRRERRDFWTKVGTPDELDELSSRESAGPGERACNPRVRAILEAFPQLTEPEREILTLVHGELLDRKEAGERLGIGHEAARQRHSRAVQSLRRLSLSKLEETSE